MVSGSFTIQVTGKTEPDWQGDPKEGAEAPEPRLIRDVVLIPRTHPDDETIIIDGYQIVITDTEQAPPGLEDTIKLLDHPIADADVKWQIDGNVAPYTKRSGELKAIIFVVKRVA